MTDSGADPRSNALEALASAAIAAGAMPNTNTASLDTMMILAAARCDG